MSHNIKQLKPSKQSRYQQGYINPNSCKKLMDRSQPVIYRSSYEKKFVVWLENSPKVLKWGSECLHIPYIYVDGSTHKYYPDYYVELVDGTKMLVEIKPSSQTVAPKNDNAWQRREWTKNVCKWKAAQQFCEARNIQFQILTEKTIEQLH